MGGNAVPLALMVFISVTSSPLSPKVTVPICLIPFSATMLTDFGLWCIQFRQHRISSVRGNYVEL